MILNLNSIYLNTKTPIHLVPPVNTLSRRAFTPSETQHGLCVQSSGLSLILMLTRRGQPRSATQQIFATVVAMAWRKHRMEDLDGHRMVGFHHPIVLSLPTCKRSRSVYVDHVKPLQAEIPGATRLSPAVYWIEPNMPNVVVWSE